MEGRRCASANCAIDTRLAQGKPAQRSRAYRGGLKGRRCRGKAINVGCKMPGMLPSRQITSINLADTFAHSLLGITDRIKNVSQVVVETLGAQGLTLDGHTRGFAALAASASSDIRITPEQADASLDGERKTVTALFADIKGSTEFMEDLYPEDARQVIDPALKLMIDAVHCYDGYVVQSTGDGIFALFGAPLAREDHPQRALYAAGTAEFRAQCAQPTGPLARGLDGHGPACSRTYYCPSVPSGAWPHQFGFVRKKRLRSSRAVAAGSTVAGYKLRSRLAHGFRIRNSAIAKCWSPYEPTVDFLIVEASIGPQTVAQGEAPMRCSKCCAKNPSSKSSVTTAARRWRISVQTRR